MAETDAIIGGESSGGLAVRGHISGKDGIYAAALLVEMLAVTGKKLSELYREICGLYGELAYAEASFTMTNERKGSFSTSCLKSCAIRTLTASTTSAVRTAARSISRMAAG